MATGKIGQWVRISGWYLEDSARDRRKNSAPAEATHRVRLGDSYVFSVRRYNLKLLEVTDTKKFAGHYFNPRRVRGVVDLTDNSLEKFYVAEETVPELEHLIELYREEYVVGSKIY